MHQHQRLRIGATARHIASLGPGQRFVIWTQGCPRRCPGCIAPEMQPLDGGHMVEIDTLVHRFIQSGDSGLTISGGEPFLQCEPLCALLDEVRAVRDVGVIVYTGYTLEELKNLSPAANDLLEKIDVLIDGPYVEARNDDLGLRGSSNQRCIFLTERYRNSMNAFGQPDARTLEYRLWNDGFFVIGVPARRALERLKGISKD